MPFLLAVFGIGYPLVAVLIRRRVRSLSPAKRATWKQSLTSGALFGVGTSGRFFKSGAGVFGGYGGGSFGGSGAWGAFNGAAVGRASSGTTSASASAAAGGSSVASQGAATTVTGSGAGIGDQTSSTSVATPPLKRVTPTRAIRLIPRYDDGHLSLSPALSPGVWCGPFRVPPSSLRSELPP